MPNQYPHTPDTRRRTEARRRTPAPTGRGRWAVDHARLIGLLVVLLVALLAEMPWVPRPQRTFLLQAAVVGLFTGIAAAGTAEARPLPDYLRGLNGWILGLMAWSVVCALLSPYRAFAVAEGLRLLLGAGVYFAAAYVLTPRETRALPLALIGAGALVAAGGLFQFGAGLETRGDEVTSIFGNHEQLGSFLALLFVPALALALDTHSASRRLLFAQGAALVLGAALLLCRTRSAWAGAAAGCVLLSLLALRYAPVKLTRANKALIIGPALLVLLAFVGLLGVSQLAPLVSTRAATLAKGVEDTSFADRLHRWRAACRMASEKPVTGWGLGAWPVEQGRWTHQGDDVPEVLASGTGHSNLAHNFWVQWAAETGGLGLALQVAVLAAFIGQILTALRSCPREDRPRLMAALAAVVAGAVDMIGAPSYTFPGVSSLWWVWVGLGAALSLRDTDAAPRPVSALAPALAGALAAALVLGVGDRLRAEGDGVPRGTLTLTAAPPGPVVPGTRVLWTATYHAPDGSLRATAPGTVWTTSIGHLDKTSPTFITVNRDPLRSGWQDDVPPGESAVTVTAHYWDNFSRPYTVSRTVGVK